MLDGKQVNANTLSFDVATVALKGARDYQEDSLIASFPIGQDSGFAVLADGMGGHTSGHVASALVVAETFSRLKMKHLAMEAGDVNIPLTLTEAAEAANERVSEHIAQDDEAYGMGSTLLSTVIRHDKLFWISIGDSPLFLFRQGELRQLNADHSMAPQIDMMVKVGAMTAEVGKTHPDRNTLTSAISGGSIDKIDCPDSPVTLLPDDIVISASDGLQYLSNGTIAKTLNLHHRKSSVDIANALMDEIEDLDHPKQDNAAFVVTKLGVREPDDARVSDFGDIPVLAVVTDKEETAEAEAETTDITDDADTKVEESAAMQDDEVDAPAEETERKAYWYRGQKYYKD